MIDPKEVDALVEAEGPVFLVEGSESVARDFVSSGPMGDGESLGCLNMLMAICHLKVRYNSAPTVDLLPFPLDLHIGCVIMCTWGGLF